VDTLLPVDAETPRSLILDPPLTDEQFQELCFANDWFRFERTREGEILMHPPTGGFTSRGNAEIIGQRQAWWKTLRRGATYGSNEGFTLDLDELWRCYEI
jgi:Uma2 family endonuclease